VINVDHDCSAFCPAVIEMATNEGDRIFDPFGGSGTTFLVAELKKRRWTGCENLNVSKRGILAVIEIEHDRESLDVPRLTKGTDGRALV
jgi:DNA modification methylase